MSSLSTSGGGSSIDLIPNIVIWGVLGWPSTQCRSRTKGYESCCNTEIECKEDTEPGGGGCEIVPRLLQENKLLYTMKASRIQTRKILLVVVGARTPKMGSGCGYRIPNRRAIEDTFFGRVSSGI